MMWERLFGNTSGHLPDTLWLPALEHIPYATLLSAADQRRMQSLVYRFLKIKHFEGAQGCVVTDAMRVEIAVQACLLILNLGLNYYRGWRSIIVYPGDFVVEKSVMDDDGIVHEWTDEISGESWEQGPVILSWEACSEPTPDMNVVMHEFAHKLDMLDGVANGCPPLPPEISTKTWAKDFSAAYAFLIDSIESDPALPLDAYAAENPAEFFAVLCEQFFLQPGMVNKLFPSIYLHLTTFFRQDPLALVSSR